MSLPEQLTRAFIAKEIDRHLSVRDVAARAAIRPRAQGVDVTERRGARATAAPHHRLGVHEIGVAKPEHREVDVGEAAARPRHARGRDVPILRRRQPLREVGEVRHRHGLSVRPQNSRASIGRAARVREQRDELRACPQAKPSAVEPEVIGVHASAHRRVREERRTSVRLRLFAVVGDREDQFRRRMVVREEKVLVARVQRVRPRDHLLDLGARVRIARGAGVDLRVQVHLRQQHGDRPLVRTGIPAGARRRQIVPDGRELGDDVVEDLRARALLRRGEA